MKEKIEELLIKNNDWKADKDEVEISGVEFSRETMDTVINDLSTLIQEERNLEEWKTIVGFPKYQISNKGRVKNEQKILKLGKGGKSGDYPYIILTNGKEKRTFRIHKLVALYFVPNPLGAGTVNHKDLNKDNNNAENLEWVTIRENINHGWDNGAYNTDRVRKSQDENIHKASKALRKEVAQYTTDGEFVKSYVSVSEASRETGIPFRNISAVTKGRQKTCHGYLWKYLESEGVKSYDKVDTPNGRTWYVEGDEIVIKKGKWILDRYKKHSQEEYLESEGKK